MADGVMVAPTRTLHAEEILTPAALTFVASLHRRFAARQADLQDQRSNRREAITRAGRLTFNPDTTDTRESDWHVARPPSDLLDRRVEISTPPQGAAMIAALNAGAQVWLADFGAMTPHWDAIVGGQLNLRESLLGTVSVTHPDGQVDRVRLDATLPTIIVRPRPWLAAERNLVVDGEPASAALVDFGLYAFHNAVTQLAGGSSAYFSLPVDSQLEAALWAEVLQHAEELLEVPGGSLRVTVAINSLPAAVEMDEILHELRAHTLGLMLDIEGYLFDFIESLPDVVLPAEPFGAPFVRSLAAQLVRTAHRRGTHAIGPVTGDYRQLAEAGFDGARVIDRHAVSTCTEAFDAVLADRPNQISRLRYDVIPDAAALTDLDNLEVEVRSAELRDILDALPRYFAAWLGGEVTDIDAGTAELARAQVWQWVRDALVLADTRAVVDAELVRGSLDEQAFEHENYELARVLVEQLCLDRDFRPSALALSYDLLD
jgi:malate synthase